MGNASEAWAWQALDLSAQVDAALQHATRLVEAGHCDEADAVALRLLPLAGDDPELWSIRARCAEARGDPALARVYWDRVLEADPAHTGASVALAYLDYREGEPQRAERRLARVLAQHPGHAPARLCELRLMMRHDDAGRVVAHARQIAPLLPTPADRDYVMAVLRARLLLVLSPDALRALDPDDVLGIGAAETAAATQPVSPGQLALRPDLMLQTFASLGGDCEFGMLQRKYRCEPLDLLRWSCIAPQSLLALLDADLADYDAPDNFRLSPEGMLNEYLLRDRRYGSYAHTFVHRHESDAKVLLDRLMQRQRLLCRKFRDDLAEGRRGFVYKPMQPIDDVACLALRDALGRQGARRLLVVRPPDPRHPPGSVTELDGVCIGHTASHRLRIHTDDWHRILHAAHRLWQ